MSEITLRPVEGIGEITEGTDLGTLVAGIPGLADGDVVTVTSKVVAKAEGRVVAGTRDDVIDAETVRVVAARGPVRIVENRQGLVLAAAGIDASNVAAGHVVLLPDDPDASARRVRERVRDLRGIDVAVVVTDTAGRPWRTGQTDIAIGVAGLLPLESLAGERDAYGNELAVTAPAVADEIAAAAELAAGKLSGCPVVVVTGLADRVLPAGDHGPGARALQRDRAGDLFALGTREAVVAALAGRDAESFGTPATADELLAALAATGIAAGEDPGPAGPIVVIHDRHARERAAVVAFAHRWEPAPGTTGDAEPADRLRLRPATP